MCREKYPTVQYEIKNTTQSPCKQNQNQNQKPFIIKKKTNCVLFIEI